MPEQQQRPSKVQLSAAVAREVELRSVAFRNWSVKFDSERPGPPLLTQRMSVNPSQKIAYELDEEGHTLDVYVRFSVDGTPQAEGERVALSLKCELVLRYQFAEAPTFEKAHYKAFSELNGLINAWPYLREFVQSSSVRLGLPPLHLPLLRLPGKPSKSASTQKAASH